MDHFNNIPSKRIGFLTPNSITNEFDSIKVQAAKKKHNITTLSEPPWQAQSQSQKDFENSNTDLKVNDYCYIDFNEKLFDKSYDVKVKVLFLL